MMMKLSDQWQNPVMNGSAHVFQGHVQFARSLQNHEVQSSSGRLLFVWVPDHGVHLNHVQLVREVQIQRRVSTVAYIDRQMAYVVDDVVTQVVDVAAVEEYVCQDLTVFRTSLQQKATREAQRTKFTMGKVFQNKAYYYYYY